MARQNKITSNAKPNFWYWTFTVLILVFSLLIRIPNINRPLLDAHYFRQTQTATVARNYFLQGIDLLRPQLDIFGSGKEGTLILEFPLFQAIVGVVSSLVGFHDYIGRFVSLIFGLMSGVILVLIIDKVFSNKKLSIVALVFYLFNPLNFYFHQAFLIESTVIFFHLLSIYLWLRYSESLGKNLLLSATIFTAIAFIMKVIYAPFLLVIVLSILFYKTHKNKFYKWLPGIFFSVFVLLAWVYYAEISNLNNGHVNFTMFNTSQQNWNFGTLAERLDPVIWKQKLLSIQNNLIKLQWPFFIYGVILLSFQKFKNKKIVIVWLLSMVFYYLTFFRIQSHDYYFMLVLSITSIVSSFGLVSLIDAISGKLNFHKKNLPVPIFLIAFLLVLFTYKSMQNSRQYFQIDINMEKKFKIINREVSESGNILFILDQYDWNSVYTYYTNRKGIVFAASDISPEVINSYSQRGYRYAVIIGNDSIEQIYSKFPLKFHRNENLNSSGDTLIIKI